MNALRRFFANWWVLSILAAVVVAVILVLVLPLFIHPLQPLIWRLAMLGLVVVVWAIFAAFRIFAARQASDRIADALARERSATASEGAVVGQRMAEALGQLKNEGGRRRDYLYSRPWYVIVGPPGAGKTTAILNSGLRFPFSDRSVKGVGGTRNLDFWFADEAVIVDTAGRYTSQDSSENRDREGWIRFLDLLRKNRPLQPINGVIVAIGVDTLLTGDVAEIDRHADTIRRRLLELKQGLEVSAPVYVLFTKSDLMAGFSEFFEDLDVEQRRAVVGSTFAVAGPAPDAAQIARAFDEVTEALDERTAKRLQDELDMRRRGLILGFPCQIAGLRNAIARLLDGAFPHDAREGPARLRGFYFTSGVQQGAPLDRLMGAAASVYDAPPPAARSGRAYFLNRLLMEVMFGEAGMVEGTAGAKARRGAILTTGLVVTAVLASLVLVAWIGGFIGDLGAQQSVLAQATDAAAKLQPYNLITPGDVSPTQEIEAARPVFDVLRNLPGGYEARRKGQAPFADWVGLGDAGLGGDAEHAYLAALQRVMLPRLLFRMEDVQHGLLGGAGVGQDSGALFAPLKAYLILGGQQPKGFDSAALKRWITSDWASAGPIAGNDKSPERTALSAHLDALLGDRDRDRVWAQNVAPLDGPLIAASRQALASVPIGQRVYAQMKEATATAGPDWTLLNPKTQITDDMLWAFSNPDDLRRLSVPYLYTMEGYAKAYQPALAQATTDMAANAWVLGQHESRDDLEGGVQDAQALYAADYIAKWKAVLSAPLPADYFNNAQARNAMVAPPYPFKLYLQAVMDQTKFTPAPAPPTGTAGQLASLMPGGGSIDAGGRVAAAFDGLKQYLASGKVDQLIAALNTAAASYSTVATTNALQTSDNPATQATVSLLAAAAGSPVEVSDFVAQIGKSGSVAGAGASLSATRNAYDAIKDACVSATNGFPFEPTSATDASMIAVIRMFGPAGPLDTLTGSLQSEIEDTNAPTWHWKADVGTTLDKESAERLQQAKAIQTILRPEGLQLEITQVGGASFPILRIGDTTYNFAPGQAGPAPFKWSTASNGVAELDFPGQPRPFQARGDWALFRLFSLASVTQSGPPAKDGSTIWQAQFGGGGAFVTFKVVVPPGVRNPFVKSAGSSWAFRCPSPL